MHEKYAKDGLVCLSVSVDDPDEQAKTLAFLTKQQATFANYLIAEPGEVWQPKLDVSAPPSVLVFGRDGKRVRKFTTEDPFTYEDVEKVVVPLLKGK
jgi:hypothetical protein